MYYHILIIIANQFGKMFEENIMDLKLNIPIKIHAGTHQTFGLWLVKTLERVTSFDILKLKMNEFYVGVGFSGRLKFGPKLILNSISRRLVIGRKFVLVSRVLCSGVTYIRGG